MLGWTYVGRNDPSWGETLARHRRQQDYYRRKNDPIWEDGPLTSTDYIQIVKAAPPEGRYYHQQLETSGTGRSGQPSVPGPGEADRIGPS